MRLGRHLRTLVRQWPFVAGSAALALVMAVWSVFQIGLSPPRLEPRALEMATATTHVVVDTPRSSILDLRQDTYSLEALRQRAIVLGNVIAEGRVSEAIAQRADVPPGVLQVTPPLTAEQPRAIEGSETQKHASDILESTDQYRLSIQANPTVPMMDIYAQAPTAEGAQLLANATVDELRSYIGDLALAEQTPEADRVRLVQLGRADGAVVNRGIQWQVALLAFALTFVVACATVIFFMRLRQGWRLAELSEQSAKG